MTIHPLSYLCANPLLARLMYRRKGRSTRWFIFLGAGVSGLVFLASVVGAKIFHESGLIPAALGIAFLALIALPPYVAYAAGVMLTSEVSSESYSLLCVTPLSNTQLLEGHILSILHRLRAPLLIVVGLAPVLLLMAMLADPLTAYLRCRSYTSPILCQFTLQPASVVAIEVLDGITIAVALSGAVWLGIALGAGLALLFRTALVASLIASFVLFMLMITVISLVATNYYNTPNVSVHVVYLTLAFLPYLAGFAILSTARGLVRRHS